MRGLIKRAAGLWLVVAAVGMLVGACDAAIVRDEPATPEQANALVVNAPTTSAHNVALISVDFEPPLRQDLPLPVAADGVALLVAVDNKGSFVERGVRVEATLTGGQEDDVLLTESQTLDVLAPGEVQVVRFKALPPVPLRPQYALHVAVHAVSGEVATADNQRILYFRLVASK